MRTRFHYSLPQQGRPPCAVPLRKSHSCPCRGPYPWILAWTLKIDDDDVITAIPIHPDTRAVGDGSGEFADAAGHEGLFLRDE